MESLRTGGSTRNPESSQQIGSFFLGILVGLALLALGFALLVWNESQAVKAFKSLDEGFNIVVSLKNIDEVNQDNKGKLVHLIGALSTDKPRNPPPKLLHDASIAPQASEIILLFVSTAIISAHEVLAVSKQL
ncbi:hypothetical protein CHS0354_005389 [Potamilus streckersoni]|uniref:Uncharacterized protein n=1 Tax=Potamilus streckersoni TaxID=2493646 RepID=A0AAE0VXX0_9BIVA|nr:hypothetical protein CHS0354_005389 [Potamilus streckersoni]